MKHFLHSVPFKHPDVLVLLILLLPFPMKNPKSVLFLIMEYYNELNITRATGIF